MALDPKLLNSLPDTLVDLYGLVEIDILSDMARRISTYDYFIPAAQHQMQKLQELGMVQSEIIARLSALTGQTQEEIVSLLSEASAEAIADDVEYYTAADVYAPDKVNTEALHAQLNSGLLQTQNSFFNITRTTANTASKQFERALDRAWLQINTGGFDYTTAIKNAITDLADAGIGSIEYPSGRIDNIEVAVRRAVVTGANQTAMKSQEVLADELEVDLVEVTAHGGARPSHAKWQGQVFSRKGRITIDGVTYEDLETATRYGHGDGLGGWNCRHNFHPYVPGAPRAWSDKELKALEEKRYTHNGEKLTEYEASQVQRKIERDIRTQKRKVAALEAIGEDASAERKLLREAQKSYTDFSEQTGMRKQSARTQIASKKAEREVKAANKAAGVKPSTQKSIEAQREQMPTTAVKVQKTQENPEKTTPKPLTSNPKSGIIEHGATRGALNDENDPYSKKRTAHAKRYYKALRNSSTDAFVDAVSKNTSIDSESVRRAYRHLFEEKHMLEDGYGYFKADYDMAESLRRLRTNDNIQEHDRILILHEAYESELMRNNPELSYEEAHRMAEEKYNYAKALKEWLRKGGA